jgi:hypothetical protein
VKKQSGSRVSHEPFGRVGASLDAIGQALAPGMLTAARAVTNASRGAGRPGWMDEVTALLPTPLMRAPGTRDAARVHDLVEHCSARDRHDHACSTGLAHPTPARRVTRGHTVGCSA